MFKRKQVLKSTVLLGVILILLITLAGIIAYRYYIETNLATSNCNIMDGIVLQQRSEFASKLDNQKRNIKTYANIFARNDLNQEEIISELTLIVDNSTFANATLAEVDGNAIENTGSHLNVSDRDYFTKALAGETVIDGSVESKVTGENIVIFATPVKRRDVVVSVLIGVYDAKNLSSLLQASFGGRGYAYVAANDGRIMARTDGPELLPLYANLFDSLANIRSYKYDGLDDIKANILSNQAGHIHYKIEGEKCLMHYVPLGINDWTVFSVANESVVASQGANIIHSTSFFAIGIFLLCLAAILYFFSQHRKHMRELSEIAFVDGLTGSANRKKFKITASEFLTTKNLRYAFVSMDIDKFKVLNDTLGYTCGDRLLICIANVIKEIMRVTKPLADATRMTIICYLNI